MKKNSSAIIMLILVLLTFSCRGIDAIDSVIHIDVPSEGLIFEWESKEQEIEIYTNETSWEFICQAPWLKIERRNNRLVLWVENNSGLDSRKTHVVVFAGDERKTIQVTQKSRGVYFDFAGSEFRIPYWGETKTLYLKTNIESWEAESDAEWISISTDLYLGQIVVSIDENKTKAVRTGRVVLKGSGAEGILTFVQDPIEQYFLPIFKWGQDSDISEILYAEEARKNELIVVPAPPSPPYQQAQLYYQFKTHSSLFPTVKYQTLNFGTKFIFKAVLVANNKEVFEDQAFQKFMNNQGFQEVSRVSLSDGYRVMYTNSSSSIEAMVMVNRLSSELIFIPVVKQPRTMQTLDRLYHFDNNLVFYSSSPTQVEEYEVKIGGKRDDWWCQYLTEQTGVKTELFHSDEPFFSRWYFFRNDKLSEVKYMFSTLNVGYYEYGGLYLITDEFKKVLKDNGFVENLGSRDFDKNIFGFDNKKKGLRLITTRNTWNEKPVFAYHIFAISKSE